MTQELFAHRRGINKQNNYDHAYPSLFIACHGRCAKNILRCKSVVCANQLGINLQFTLRITKNLNYQKIWMFQFGSTS